MERNMPHGPTHEIIAIYQTKNLIQPTQHSPLTTGQNSGKGVQVKEFDTKTNQMLICKFPQKKKKKRS